MGVVPDDAVEVTGGGDAGGVAVGGVGAGTLVGFEPAAVLPAALVAVMEQLSVWPASAEVMV